MSGRYDDMLYLPRPVSARRKRMPLIDRAAQFSPFAALTGFEAAIEETGRLTDRQIDLDVDGVAMLDEKLRLLAEHLSRRPRVMVIYFRPDASKSGGAYVRTEGRVRRIDRLAGVLLLEDGMSIEFERICDMESEIFGDTERA